jgi:asparagine synthase (glutamine-hydrolysing)
MCGIFSYIGDRHSFDTLVKHADKIKHRGPDSTQYKVLSFANRFGDEKIFMAFYRLAINGLDGASNQPLKDSDEKIYLICNGEIFNFKELIKEYGFEDEYKTESDCEIIIHLYKRFGIEKTCKLLDGEFSFFLVDNENKTFYIARDQLGVRPLFWHTEFFKGSVCDMYISSEMKSFIGLINGTPTQFPPGSFWSSEDKKVVKYYNYVSEWNKDNEEIIIKNIRELFLKAVDKRLLSERKLACLLSGGLDSSTVAAIVANKFGPGQLNTYSIGMKGSVDLYYAKMMADYIKSNHVNIELTEEQFLDGIEKTIVQIESYDTTSVRASVGNYLVSLYIKDNSEDTVIFCGDVSDEIFGSYRGFSGEHADNDFYLENVKMLDNIHYFDILRSDRTISGAGLEARVPFADGEFVKYVMSIHPQYKKFNKERMEKYLFRKAFEDILPAEILWRRKEAFSDGVSSESRSWFTIIKEFVDKIYSDDEYEEKIKKYTYNQPYDKESLYYREIFEKYYPNMEETIPYFWRHPFSTQKDPSARLLESY